MFLTIHLLVFVDDEDLFLQTKEYLQEIAPDKVSIVKHYQSRELPLFEKYHIERQIKTSFGKRFQ